MFTVSHNIEQLERGLSDLAQNQLPFALAMAINDTAEDVAEAEEREIDQVFQSPTPFTRKAIFRTRAQKRRPEATVGVKRIQREYLKRQAKGGKRMPKGRAIVVPNKQRVNKYGNMPKGVVKRLLAKPDVFVASKGDARTKHLAPGIYKRGKRLKSGKVKPSQQMVAFHDFTDYRAIYDFQGKAAPVARARMPHHLVRRLKRAIETAK